MRKTLLLFVLACTTFACTKEPYYDDEAGNKKIESRTKAGGDNIYDVLGYGYDITGEYFRPHPVRPHHRSE